MKGFPNQVADLAKLAKGIQTLASLFDAGRNARDDGVYGEALVRAGVAGTGHSPRPIEEYIHEQRTKPFDRQSFRTTARGLRQFYRIVGFIEDSRNLITIAALGRQASMFAGVGMDATQVAFWRRAIRNMCHDDDGKAESSHPYQVLLRLIARHPGIAKPMCALALEARNDSEEELERIVALSARSEADALRAVGITLGNWKNAVKVLPKLAEQLGDVEILGSSRARAYQIADAPGAASRLPTEETPPIAPTVARMVLVRSPRPPRASRAVTPDSIGRAGTAEDFDDVIVPPEMDPEAATAAIATRRDRLRRHNLIVREFARILAAVGTELFEDPFDFLAIFEDYCILGEVKTLDGTVADERERVRDALSQLLYYEAFVTRPVVGEAVVRKVACFEGRISDDHQRFLNALNIGTVWKNGDHFSGDVLALEYLGDLLA